MHLEYIHIWRVNYIFTIKICNGRHFETVYFKIIIFGRHIKQHNKNGYSEFGREISILSQHFDFFLIKTTNRQTPNEAFSNMFTGTFFLYFGTSNLVPKFGTTFFIYSVYCWIKSIYEAYVTLLAAEELWSFLLYCAISKIMSLHIILCLGRKWKHYLWNDYNESGCAGIPA